MAYEAVNHRHKLEWQQGPRPDKWDNILWRRGAAPGTQTPTGQTLVVMLPTQHSWEKCTDGNRFIYSMIACVKNCLNNCENKLSCKLLKKVKTYSESKLKMRLEGHINLKDTGQSVNITISQLKAKAQCKHFPFKNIKQLHEPQYESVWRSHVNRQGSHMAISMKT